LTRLNNIGDRWRFAFTKENINDVETSWNDEVDVD